MEWRPIETAPKDGSDIIAFDIVPCVVHWYDGHKTGMGNWYSQECTVSYPTHWIPIPPSPSKEPSNERV